MKTDGTMTTTQQPLKNRGFGGGWFVKGKWAVGLALLFVMLGVALTGIRTYKKYSDPTGPFDLSNSGMSDFHNGAYLPSLAFRNRVNPYSLDVREKYNLARSAPPYSPVVFMLHAPLTYFTVKQADVLFFAINVLLIGGIAYASISMSNAEFRWAPWLWLFGLFVFSRPGHITLFTGYFTAELVIGTLVALHFAKSRPFLAGVGMLLASGKPTYILPLTILMFCRRDYKAVAIGLALCVVFAGLGVGWLASDSSFANVLKGVQEGQAAFDDDPNEDPVNTWTRLDTVGVVSKIMAWKPDNKTYLVAMLLLLIIPGIAVWRISPSESNTGGTGLSAMIVSLAILIAIYHHSYDCLLVTVVWVGVTFFGKTACPKLGPFERYAISGLLAIPAVNYFSTWRFRDVMGVDNQSFVWNAITSLNGICLLLALLILLRVAFRESRQVDPEERPIMPS
jgi:hypothetical protein